MTLPFADALPETSSTQWDGADMKAAGGLNAGIYNDAGYNGQAYAAAGGRLMRIGMIYTNGWYDHPAFLDNPDDESRAFVYNCTGSPCAENQSNDPGVGAHDLKCAGLAAGNVRGGQISEYTSQQRLDRTGVAQEPEIYFLEGTGMGSATHAIEQAIDLELDVLSGSRGSPEACNGNRDNAYETALMAAQEANILVVIAAGNGGQGGCNIYTAAGLPSVFAVGATGSGSNTCTSSNYSNCSIASFSSEGGYDATVDGVTRSGAISGVSAAVPGCPQYYVKTHEASPSPPNENYFGVFTGNTSCGTSYAAPQVAGAAILMKDYFLANDYSFIGIEGRPHVVMLAMTDRQSQSGYLSNGFDSVWGGGRFQMRRFDASDHTGVWGWESYSHFFTSEGPTEHVLWDTDPEPASLNQAKVYMTFFEQDATDIAQIDLRLMPNNCASGSLGLDSGYDVKKMVRAGSNAANQSLCVRLNAMHLPSGASRRAHVFAYYSNNTAMR